MKEINDFIYMTEECDLANELCILNRFNLSDNLKEDYKSPICMICYSQKFLASVSPQRVISFCSNVFCPDYHIIKLNNIFWIFHGRILLFTYFSGSYDIEVKFDSGKTNITVNIKDHLALFSVVQELVYQLLFRKQNFINLDKIIGIIGREAI